MDFGAKPLSHPLLVEAIEDEFEAVCIFNNVKGVDAEVLARFNEPSWNNPVVRFLDADGRDLIARKDRVWTSAAFAPRVVASLRKAARPVPAYLALAAEEFTQPAPKPKDNSLDHLNASPLRYLPLTPAQAAKVNAALGAAQKPEASLSPRQRKTAAKVARQLETHPGSLKGLARPDSLEQLPRYAAQLEAALNKKPRR